MVYVSVTGLEVRSPIHLPRFLWHTIRSMRQAGRAPGNLLAEGRRVNGVWHTMSVWTNREAMRAFMVAGPHLRAMKAFRALGTGRVVGFEAAVAPGWEEARAHWIANAREV